MLKADEDGEIAITTLTDKGLDVHASAHVLSQDAWTAPTLVGTTLYVRDRANIVALDVSE